MSDTQSNTAPRALIIAGPNGAGKTTFAREFLPAEGHCPTFINADLIAIGLSPFRPDAAVVEASRLMLEHVRRSVAKRNDFAVETTLAGRAYLRFITEWQAAGYEADLRFLHLPSTDLAVEREVAVSFAQEDRVHQLTRVHLHAAIDSLDPIDGRTLGVCLDHGHKSR